VSSPFSVANTLLPVVTSEGALSSVFSVANISLPTTGPQNVNGNAFSVLNSAAAASTAFVTGQSAAQVLNSATALQGAAAAAVSVVSPQSGVRLVEGQTITVTASVANLSTATGVEFAVNDQVIARVSTSPYAFTFTVPAGVDRLTFGASAIGADGAPVVAATVAVPVDPDPGTVVTGRVVDASGAPVAGATVELVSQGLQADFFDFSVPLRALPDLTGRTPDRQTRVTAINQPNPQGVFGVDPFGAHFTPDYAARFRGWLRIGAAGAYTFVLGANEGATLTVNGVRVVNMPTAVGAYQEGAGTIDLAPGFVPIEVSFFAGATYGGLQLSFIPPNGERQVVPDSLFVPNAEPFVTTTDETGHFTFTGVPMALESVQAQASVTRNGQLTTASSPRVTPVAKDGVDLGSFVLPVP
jgi:hypothetical protein